MIKTSGTNTETPSIFSKVEWLMPGEPVRPSVSRSITGSTSVASSLLMPAIAVSNASKMKFRLVLPGLSLRDRRGEVASKKSPHPCGGGGSQVLKAVRTAPVRSAARGWPREPCLHPLIKSHASVERPPGLDSVPSRRDHRFHKAADPCLEEENSLDWLGIPHQFADRRPMVWARGMNGLPPRKRQLVERHLTRILLTIPVIMAAIAFTVTSVGA